MRQIDWTTLSTEDQRAALARPAQRTEARVSETVRAAFAKAFSSNGTHVSCG